MINLSQQLRSLIQGDVADDLETLKTFSHDASLFEVMPQVVVFPKDTTDVENVIKFVSKNKKTNPNLSITARSAGTDMGGGSINDSIILAFQKYMNNFLGLQGDVATAQPGMFYRDFEKETLKHNLIFPSYPASREICAIGGIVNNNSGGEKSLEYGKTERFVKELKVVLSDGKEYSIKALDDKELKAKMRQKNFEGQFYRKIYKLIADNYELLQQAKPKVSKNSAGYFLWNVYDKEKKIFDLTKLFVGAQGTLGIVTQASIKLVPTRKHAEMMIIFLHDLSHLGQIINEVLPLKPDSFEAYDDNTLKLAMRFFYSFAKLLGTKNIIQTGFQFIPEFLTLLTFGMPKMVLQIDFTGDNPEELASKIAKLREKLKPLHPKTRIATEDKEKKYWLIRRESFNLLRQKIADKHTAPFIDDIVVNPQYLSEFLPKLTSIMKKYPGLIYTVAGHVGDGNFHIIPLMDIKNSKLRAEIPTIGKEVYDLVLSYHGSTTGEHNDGLIRTPYLKQMYGEKIIKLFEETKKIFDPQNIFNPRKKVHPDLDFAMKHIRTQW